MCTFIWDHAQGLSDVCKVALIVLALIASVLGIGGEKWNKQKKRLTGLGYLALGVALLVGVAGGVGWRADDDVKANADQKTKEAVANKEQEDDRRFALVVSQLTKTGFDQHTALEIAMTQLPIQEIELTYKRSELEPFLPADLKGKNFSFVKPVGSFYDRKDDDLMIRFESWSIGSDDPMEQLNSMKSGRDAISDFRDFNEHVCRIEISPGSVPEEKLLYAQKINYDETYLTSVELSKDSLTYVFVPSGLPAAYFDKGVARLQIGRSYTVSEGPSAQVEKPLPPCLKPRELNLRMSTLGFESNTAIKASWKEDFNSWTAFSPELEFKEQNKTQP